MFDWLSRLRRKASQGDMPRCWDLSTSLLKFSPRDGWTIGNAVEGTAIFGATGSGKTSGSGAAIARAFLSAGFGGLVLTAKPGEVELWRAYCRATGRENDLVVFGPEQPHRFNFIDYEVQRKGRGAGLCANLAALLGEVQEVAERGTGGGSGREDEGYWKRASRQLCINLMELSIQSLGRVSIPELYRLVVSAPTSPEQMRSAEWKAKSVCYQCLSKAQDKEKTPVQGQDFELVVDYFLFEYPQLSDKTRSVIVSTLTSTIDVLNRGIARELLSGTSNVTPEDCHAGKIIALDLPVKEFAETGQFVQVLWKSAFQRAVERRNLSESARPVFLWADEAQFFVTSQDSHYQTTCRAARAATVYLSQNLSNYLHALGGEHSRPAVDSLMGNLNTKLFCANGDPVTNEWAASLAGKSRQFFTNSSTSHQSDDWLGNLTGFRDNAHTSAGMSEQNDYDVPPSAFTTLRTGGAAHSHQVDAIAVQSGRRFNATGKTWMPVTFRQSIAR